MYWYSNILDILLQIDAPHIDLNYDVLQLFIGMAIGLFPGIITAYAARRKWYEGEKSVVQSQAGINQTAAIENIANAASLIATQSQALSDKSTTLIGLLEEEVTRQQAVIEQERTLRLEIQEQHQEEILLLKSEIRNINEKIESCSIQLKELIKDLRSGKVIDLERLNKLERSLP